MNKEQHTHRSAKKDQPVYIKGVIAIMSTVLVVTIITLLFAKTLFVTSSSEEKKTGRLTAPPTYVTTTTTLNTTKKKTTTTTTMATSHDPYKSELIQSGVTEMEVKSAVYLHPEPNSTSKNLMVLPQGARVTAYAVVNYNWIYVDYMGNRGYAYGDFFTGDRPTNKEVPDSLLTN